MSTKSSAPHGPHGGHHDDLHTRVLTRYARAIVAHPGRVLGVLLAVVALSTWATTKLTIDSNQLNLIKQDLPEVTELKRVIDMVGGAGYLVVALRAADGDALRKVADDVAHKLENDKKNVRFVTYRLSVDFIKQKLGLFIDTKDLESARTRVDAYLRDQLKRASPFFFEITPTEPVKLDLQDLIQKYGHVGHKNLKDDYNVSDDGGLLVLFVKPMWDSNDLGQTKRYVEELRAQLADYSKNNANHITLEESSDRASPPAGKVTYGFTGQYELMVDDSYAIADSLGPVSIIAFILILVITIAFFRRVWPTLIVISGMVAGTLVAMGFAYVTFGQLNMVTSILGGILMGFGVDYGIQFIYRTRIELGAGKKWDDALRAALVNAGRPASVAAVVTAGSFFILLVSDFRGFSQFGLLAGSGTLIIAFTLFCWSPAILALCGRIDPKLPAKMIGATPPPSATNAQGERRIPNPARLLTIAAVAVAVLCAAAIPWRPADGTLPFPDRLLSGIRFDYNTRALLPAHQKSVELQDEINDRFGTSADTVAIYTKDLAGAKEVFDEVTDHPEKYTAVDKPVLSVFAFVPPAERATKNAQILADWKQSLSDIDPAVLPADLQEQSKLFLAALEAKPYGVEDVPEVYASQFRELPTAKPENKGYLTFLYAKEDLRNGKALLRFADQVHTIKCASGREYHAAGPAVLYAMLARTVLRDGLVTVLLAALWILLMHWADFRSIPLALASVLPLCIGLIMMLGIMALSGESLNFMNIIILPILLGFGVSHGLYLLHRFLEGTSPVVALQSVGAAVASSTLTAIAGFGALLAASHHGLQSMGLVACIGLTTTLLVSFTVLAAVLQLLHDRRDTTTVAPQAASDGTIEPEAG